MRVVIQRVLEASVKVNNEVVGNIDNGLLVFAGYEEDDNNEDIEMEDLNEFRNKEINFEKPEAQKVRRFLCFSNLF